MNGFWENEYVQAAAYYSVVILCSIVFLAIFELVTKYKNWEEIKNGNLSVAMATGGKIFGIANIFRYSIMQHDSLFFDDRLGSVRFYFAASRVLYL